MDLKTEYTISKNKKKLFCFVIKVLFPLLFSVFISSCTKKFMQVNPVSLIITLHFKSRQGVMTRAACMAYNIDFRSAYVKHFVVLR